MTYTILLKEHPFYLYHLCTDKGFHTCRSTNVRWLLVRVYGFCEVEVE